MHLGTVSTPYGPKLVALLGDQLVDLGTSGGGLPATLRDLLAAGTDALAAARHAVESPGVSRSPLEHADFLPPVTDPPKILCVGLNYRDHAIEGGKAIPTEPVLFGKFSNTLTGHGSPIVLPRVSRKVDYEAELVLVIGKRGRDIAVTDAMQYVAGYCPGHDVSARDWQFRGEEKQWIIGKTFDTFAPVGPFLVTADEVPDPHNLRVRLRLNGRTMQDSNTREFIFRVPELIAYLSQVVTLEPGDLIFTGTPPGVGAARQPPVFLQPGDTTEVEIDGLGVLRNPVVAA